MVVELPGPEPEDQTLSAEPSAAEQGADSEEMDLESGLSVTEDLLVSWQEAWHPYDRASKVERAARKEASVAACDLKALKSETCANNQKMGKAFSAMGQAQAKYPPPTDILEA